MGHGDADEGHEQIARSIEIKHIARGRLSWRPLSFKGNRRDVAFWHLADKSIEAVFVR
jgi:hypothetical protein